MSGAKDHFAGRGKKGCIWSHSRGAAEKCERGVGGGEAGRDFARPDGWSELWLTTYKAGARSGTKQMYISILGQHILPAIGEMPLKKVCQVDIQQILNSAKNWEFKNKKGEVVKSGVMSDSMQKKILMTLDQIFETAVENHLVAANPCKGIRVAKTQQTEKIKYLSEAQQDELLHAVSGTRAELFCALGLYAGLRREESLALTWLDVDWVNRRLRIHNTVEFGANQGRIVTMTKTAAGQRVIPIAPPLLDLLKTANPEQADTGVTVIRRRDAAKNYTIHSEMICPSFAGEVMSKSSFARMWQTVEKRVSFRVTSHMLRHTYCTRLHAAGVDLRTAQYLMGHADIQVTAKIYTHIEDKSLETAQEKIDFVFGSQSNSQSLIN